MKKSFARSSRYGSIALAAVVAVASAVVAQERPEAQTPATIPASQPAYRFAAEIAKFETADAERMPEPGGVVFVGSSTIRLWKTSEAFPDLPVINRGFGGSHMEHALHYARRIVTKYQPRVVVLYEGDNDIASKKTPARVMGEIEQFADLLRAEVPNAKLVLIATKPSPRRWAMQDKMTELNALQRTYAEANASWVTYVDIVPAMLGEGGEPRPELYRDDKLHLSDAGYVIWNDAVRPVLTALMQR